MDNLILITKNITFEDLRTGKKSPIDVYQEQMSSWLFKPLDQLSKNKENSFENGYSMLGLELLFFEPHGKYLSGNSIAGSRKNFDYGFNHFLEYLMINNLINDKTNGKIRNKNFYRISRCGIFHDMTIKSGLLIDSIHMKSNKVFYPNPINNGILVSPWNFLSALKLYTEDYINIVRTNTESDISRNFLTTFNSLFQY